MGEEGRAVGLLGGGGGTPPAQEATEGGAQSRAGRAGRGRGPQGGGRLPGTHLAGEAISLYPAGNGKQVD